jgi:uncharacterized protein (TIGR02145 family)
VKRRAVVAGLFGTAASLLVPAQRAKAQETTSKIAVFPDHQVEVFIDGASRGQASPTNPLFASVIPGEHLLKLVPSVRGFDEWSRVVQVAAGQQAVSQVKLPLRDPRRGYVGAFTDPRDGEVYRTIEIAGKIWLGDNLRFKTDTSSKPGLESQNIATFGRLYPRANADELVPAGWRLPTPADWSELFDLMGANPASALNVGGISVVESRAAGNVFVQTSPARTSQNYFGSRAYYLTSDAARPNMTVATIWGDSAGITKIANRNTSGAGRNPPTSTALVSVRLIAV